MEATRARFGWVIEWVLAAVFSAAAVFIGSNVMREPRAGQAGIPVLVQVSSAPSAVPAGVPSRAVSVPVLVLAGRKEVRVGDTASAIATRLGRAAEIGTQAVEVAPFGERLTRFYEHQGTRFVLVFEPFEKNGEPKVAAIYRQ